MESEKVKEIKKALEDNKTDHLPYIDGWKCKFVEYADILTLINELESENDRLRKERDKYIIENKDIEESNIYANKFLEKYEKENQELKDRIAELENTIKNNLQYTKGYGDGVKATVEVAYPKKLNEFAERLKGKIGEFDSLYQSCADVSYSDLIKQAIDATLKEFINE